MKITHEGAVRIVLAAVSEVRDPQVARSLRPDSPVLSASQTAALVPADAAAVADAIAVEADRAGARCVLSDADFSFADQGDPTLTVAQLADAVHSRWVHDGSDDPGTPEVQ